VILAVTLYSSLPESVPAVDVEGLLAWFFIGSLLLSAFLFLLAWKPKIGLAFPFAVFLPPLFWWPSSWGESVPVCALGALVLYIIFLLAAYGQAEKEVKRQRKVREGRAKHFSQQAPPQPQSIPRPDLPPGAEVFPRKAPTTPSLPPEIMDLFRRLQSLRAMTVGRGCTMSEAIVARNKARAIEAELTRWAKANGHGGRQAQDGSRPAPRSG
jgi:hypothetical protein